MSNEDQKQRQSPGREASDLTRLLGNGWNTVSELPAQEPHRNVEVATLDAIGQVFFSKVSSYLSHAMEDLVMWREVT